MWVFFSSPAYPDDAMSVVVSQDRIEELVQLSSEFNEVKAPALLYLSSNKGKVSVIDYIQLRSDIVGANEVCVSQRVNKDGDVFFKGLILGAIFF